METRVTVQCDWESAGAVVLVEGQLTVPSLEPEPGIYQWVFRLDGHERRYVGETDGLRRRFGHYQRPGPTQHTNIRMNARALRVLEAGGSIGLLVAKDIQLEIGGEEQPVDLTSKHLRCLIESAALVDLRLRLGELVNDKGYGSLREHPILG